MAVCPAGHQTTQTDFCDTCGLPMVAPETSPAAGPASELSAPVGVGCPHCGALNVAGALFCESCGYDFTTGVVPESTWPSVEDPAPATSPEPVLPPPPPPPVPTPSAPTPSTPAPSGPEPQPGTEAVPTPRTKVEWIAEMWIDPDWYATQGSTDPLPSPGLPDIVPLVKDSSLIGRVSVSRGIYPDIDCELDTGCSRRHARLTTDSTRWWIEDLDSANGTFVGSAAGPLPAMPIPRGRVELAPDQRIYIGAWTRIVIRRATDDEREAFEG